MEKIVMIRGKVKYTITLDPGVWIFDDRKKELHTFFKNISVKDNDLEEYTKEISSHWDREIMEGAILPPTMKTEKSFIKEKLLSGTYGIPLKPFLINSSPLEGAKDLIVKTNDKEYIFDLSIGYNLILGFSKDGKPLIEDGPLHVYFGDGSNQSNPIVNVKEFKVI